MPLKTKAIAAAFVLTCASAFAAQAGAATPAPGFHSLIANSEIRTSFPDMGGSRHEVWKFSPDGTVTGNYRSDRTTTRLTVVDDEGSDVGSWHTKGRTVCIRWTRWRGGHVNCYAIRMLGGKRIILDNVFTGRVSKAYLAPVD